MSSASFLSRAYGRRKDGSSGLVSDLKKEGSSPGLVYDLRKEDWSAALSSFVRVRKKDGS